MITVNTNFLKLQQNYLFTTIARKVAAFKEANPERKVISLGIGDVTRPLVPAVIDALNKAVAEQAEGLSFRGYGPEQGYSFLREALKADYAALGVDLDADEIFISDGAKSDTANIQDIFSADAVVAVTDPVYPVYVDSNIMAGRSGEALPDGRWSGYVYLPCTRENDFVPDFPERTPDLIYLCYPNNPTGTVLKRDAVKAWVDYARKNGCVILFDAAYEAYITDPEVPHSIYEIEGAKEVAIEFRSYSKTAGFTGLRCASTVVPKALVVSDGKGGKVGLNRLWNRRQCTKYNGCPYIVQRAAEATHTPEGRAQVRAIVDGYLSNARLLVSELSSMGLEVYGGINSPYVWCHTPASLDSWAFFEKLLAQCALISTPGCGFGLSGEGYVRLTAFGTPESTAEAIERIRTIL